MLQDRTNQAGPPRSDSPVREVHPPRPVLIDLGAMYSRAPHFDLPHQLIIADLSHTVVGLLDAWVVSDSGWFGACRYKVKVAYAEWVDQSHLVPARFITPATERAVGLARMRGKIIE